MLKAKKTIQPDDVVFVKTGHNKGRIGFCGDLDGKSAIIYFGSMFFSDGYFVIPQNSLRIANIVDLLQRSEIIAENINSFKKLKKKTL